MQQYTKKNRTPFIVLERDPRKIKKELVNLYESIIDANDLTHASAKFLLALSNVDIIDEYKVAVNFINRKLHISYKWWGNGNDSMTFNLNGKVISENATRVFIKD